ncbi:pilus assembly protein TadG-related protein [Herbiconiux moechotypicola]|uniref:Putative Flp pilus-assembly TadG-like N-terminal domain-containing protein n=1 Tax=Herbiconiux moechotypicola TaxID=637393 RepID=A0ABN3E6P7_9MICO|nr:Rv3654c family TadE-like protein [Herbiconiux moechotypicola]MCS5731968.1 pilus assembly protein TadG-related protein [Herbiconiux moechotypicola]
MADRHGGLLREVTRERGSGSVLAIAVLVVAATLAGTGFLLGSALAERQRLQGAADAAALAAADVLAGRVAGEPCGVAGEVASALEARLVDCHAVDTAGEAGAGGDVVVRLGARVADLVDLTVSARAGPRG